MIVVDVVATLIYDAVFPRTHATYTDCTDLDSYASLRMPTPTRPGEDVPLVCINYQREHSIRGGPYHSEHYVWFYADHARHVHRRDEAYYYTDSEFPDNLIAAILASLDCGQLPAWARRK